MFQLKNRKIEVSKYGAVFSVEACCLMRTCGGESKENFSLGLFRAAGHCGGGDFYQFLSTSLLYNPTAIIGESHAMKGLVFNKTPYVLWIQLQSMHPRELISQFDFT